MKKYYVYANGEPSGDAARVQIEALRMALNTGEFISDKVVTAILGLLEVDELEDEEEG